MIKLFSSLFLFTAAHAGAAPDCSRVTTPREVLDCALENHPNIRVAQAALAQAMSLSGQASQRVNPELTSQGVRGGSADNRFTYLELNFAHTFELAGKRPARLARAQASATLATADLLGAREGVFREVLLTIRRLRQIKRELATIDSALSTFARIDHQYRSRPRLSPEQTAALHVFALARADQSLQRTRLEGEAEAASRELKLAVGHDVALDLDGMPARKSDWPRVEDPEMASPIAGAAVETARADIDLAAADRRGARGASWPDVQFGPTIQMQRSPSGDFNAPGFNLAVGLPLYHHNAAGKTTAELGLRKAELTRANVERIARNQRELALFRYRATVAALGAGPTDEAVDKSHAETEQLFDRGLIPVTLLLETHRQRLDLIRGQNESELAALEALARLRALEGRPFEVQP
jgi:outer membrane protein TolC